MGSWNEESDLRKWSESPVDKAAQGINPAKRVCGICYNFVELLVRDASSSLI